MMNKRIIPIYVLIISYLLGRLLVFKSNLLEHYTLIINPLFWFLLFILTLILLYDKEDRIRSKYDKVQSIIILLIAYSMGYFLSGLIFGYEYSVYSHSFISIIKNLISFVLIIIFQEYIRYKLVISIKKSFFNYLVIAILFTLISMNFINVGVNFKTNVSAFKYISVTILPLLVSNIAFTYLTGMSGLMIPLLYRSVMVLLSILLPIVPSWPWIITSVVGIIFPIVVLYYFNYLNLRKLRDMSRRRLKKESPLTLMPHIILAALLISFIAGFFKYKPISVMSNSMVPIFSRGDVVVVEKIDSNILNNLKINDIIYFRIDNLFVVHRIVDIRLNEKNKKVIITKGDNNEVIDNWEVKEDDINGIVKFSIPLIGFPSVWFSEFLLK